MQCEAVHQIDTEPVPAQVSLTWVTVLFVTRSHSSKTLRPLRASANGASNSLYYFDEWLSAGLRPYIVNVNVS